MSFTVESTDKCVVVQSNSDVEAVEDVSVAELLWSTLLEKLEDLAEQNVELNMPTGKYTINLLAVITPLPETVKNVKTRGNLRDLDDIVEDGL